jgi:hypothetical protein
MRSDEDRCPTACSPICQGRRSSPVIFDGRPRALCANVFRFIAAIHGSSTMACGPYAIIGQSNRADHSGIEPGSKSSTVMDPAARSAAQQTDSRFEPNAIGRIHATPQRPAPVGDDRHSRRRCELEARSVPIRNLLTIQLKSEGALTLVSARCSGAITTRWASTTSIRARMLRSPAATSASTRGARSVRYTPAR